MGRDATESSAKFRCTNCAPTTAEPPAARGARVGVPAGEAAVPADDHHGSHRLGREVIKHTRYGLVRVG